MATRVGRARMTSAVVPDALLTATAWNAADSLGSAYEVPYAVGQEGALLAHSNIYATASGSPEIRAHFYSYPPSAVSGGDTHVIDVAHHLGYVDHTAWVSAGGGLILSQATDPNLVLFGNSGNRSVWVALEAKAGSWALGGSATPLQHKLGVLQD